MKSRSEAKVEGGCEVTRVLQTIQHDLSPSPAGPNPDVNVRMVRDPSFRRYGQTKLANILFTAELARRLDGTDVTANCFHPALVATGFNRNNGWPMSLAMTIMKPFARSPEEGARTLVWLVDSPDVANEKGGYFVDKRRVTPSAAAQEMAAARRLWEVSEEQTREGTSADP